MTNDDWIKKMREGNHFYCIRRLGMHLEDTTNKMNYVDQIALELLQEDLEILELIKSHCKNAIFMKVLEFHVYRFVETDKEIYNIGGIEPFSKEEIEQLKRWANGN